MWKPLVLLACALAVCVGVVYGWQWLFRVRRESPEELARAALEGSTPEARELAAVKLSQSDKPAREHLLRILHTSPQPEVRMACVRGLGELWDYYSMDDLFRALEDESLLVRTQAEGTVRAMLKEDGGYRAADPPEKRAEAIQRLQGIWAHFRSAGITRAYMRERMGQEYREPSSR